MTLRPPVARAARHPVLTTAVVSVPVVAYHLLWIARHRLQGGFDGDETGYLATTLKFHRILYSEGPGSLLRAAINAPRSGPLLPLMSAPFVVTSRPLVSAMAVQPVFLAVTAVALAAITRRLAGDRASVVAGLVALGFPGAVLASRSYQLVPPVCAALCLAVLALLASRRGRSTLHLVGFGLAVGAMLLARTVAIGFLPGLALALVVVIDRSLRSWLNAAVGVAVAVAVAAPWWIHQWSSSIYPYLFRYGYGQGAGDLGPAFPPLRVAVRLGLVMVDARPLLAFPAALIVVLGVARVARSVRARGVRSQVIELAGTHREIVAVVVVVFVGWCALLSTSNIGTWFQLPLEMLAVSAVVAVAAQLGGRIPRRLGRWAVAVAALNLILISHWQIGAGQRVGGATFSLNAFGGVETSQAIDFESGDARFAPNRSTSARQQAMRDWAAAANRTARAVESVTPPGRQVMQTFIGDIRLFQATTLDLAEQLTAQGRSPWEAPNAKSTIGNGQISLDPVAGGLPRIIVAVRAAIRTSQEGYSPDPIVARALGRGWVVARRVPLPDGGRVEILIHQVVGLP